VADGSELAPGPVDHVLPQLGLLDPSSNPLKLLGAVPPLSVFDPDQWASQNVTGSPMTALRSPTMKLPPPAKGGGVGVRVGVIVGVFVLVGVFVGVSVRVGVNVGVLVGVNVKVGV
jgi:hypothetical protein